jgi:chemotaxis methyl-accepting protein methylase
MEESVSRTDALRHVRFAGRATAAAHRPLKRARPRLPATRAVAARPPERPGPFIAWVLHRAGLVVESYRGEPLARRLPACLRALHATTEAGARQILEQRPELLAAAISALLIGVTDFFRDGPVFEALRAQALPALAALHRPVRVWSAGCSTGAELYSVAILLAEAGLLEGGFLLGSDCRSDAIAHAQASLYTSHDLRKVDPGLRRRHFDAVGGAWRPAEPIRRHLHWKVADLGRHIEAGPWDMILWRNMAIYLQAESAGPVWRGLTSALAPGGVLVVGKAERPPVELPLVCVKRCVYRVGPGADPRPRATARTR